MFQASDALAGVLERATRDELDARHPTVDAFVHAFHAAAG
jgi:hypothetical protein